VFKCVSKLLIYLADYTLSKLTWDFVPVAADDKKELGKPLLVLWGGKALLFHIGSTCLPRPDFLLIVSAQKQREEKTEWASILLLHLIYIHACKSLSFTKCARVPLPRTLYNINAYAFFHFLFLVRGSKNESGKWNWIFKTLLRLKLVALGHKFWRFFGEIWINYQVDRIFFWWS